MKKLILLLICALYFSHSSKAEPIDKEKSNQQICTDTRVQNYYLNTFIVGSESIYELGQYSYSLYNLPQGWTAVMRAQSQRDFPVNYTQTDVKTIVVNYMYRGPYEVSAEIYDNNGKYCTTVNLEVLVYTGGNP